MKDRRSANNKIFKRVWKTVEAKVREVRVVKAERKREKERRER